jgi:hypothetical protein
MQIRKTNLTTFFIPVVLLLTLTGCKNIGDKEPNNTIDKASLVTLGKPFHIKINPKGDLDWLKVNVPGPGYIRIQSKTIPKGMQLDVAFARYEEWENEKEHWLRKWHRVPDALRIAKAGSYYLLVHDAYDDGASTQDIELLVSFLPEFDMHEPNNHPENAVMLESNANIRLAVYPEGDVDWFRVKVSTQGYISLKVKEVPASIRVDAYYGIYDEWKKTEVRLLRGWHTLPDAVAVTGSVEYLICLHDSYDDNSAPQLFDLKVEFLAEMDPSEPNDNFMNAKIVSAGDKCMMAIYPQGDLDYYKIKIKKGNKLRIWADKVSDVKAEAMLSIISPNDSNKLKGTSPWKILPAEFDVKPSQEYYILIHDNYDDVGNPQPFMVKFG